ncbi:putative bifunctional diguanylate cyclase/phosphodiesterase [Marinomonas epiphytica]
MKRSFLTSLFAKQAALTLLLAVGLSLLSSCYQLISGVGELQEQTEESFSEWMQVLNRPLVDALVDDDFVAVERRLESLLNYPLVSYVQLTDRQGRVIAKLEPLETNQNLIHQFADSLLPELKAYSAPLYDPQKLEVLGTVSIVPHTHRVIEVLFRELVDSFWDHLIRDIFLVSLISLLFYFLVTHPLRQLTRSLSQIQVDTHQPLFSLVGANRTDELGRLSVAFMSLWQKLRTALQTLEANNRQQALRIEYAGDAILQLDEEQTIALANVAVAKLLGIDRDLLLGRKLSSVCTTPQWQLFCEQVAQASVNSNSTHETLIETTKGNIPVEVSLAKFEVDSNLETLLLIRDITERKASEAHIHELAYYDSLTHLPNRQFLIEQLSVLLDEQQKVKQTAALVFVDLDRFKTVNDSLGHNVGDQLLCRVAEEFQKIAQENVTLMRLGGDEFAFLLVNLASQCASTEMKLHDFMSKVITACSQINKVGLHEMHVSASAGATIFQGKKDILTIFKQADTALNQAKENGRNTHLLYRASMQEAVDARLKMEKALHQALANREFKLFYQPQMNDQGSLIGSEALMRWQDQSGQFISPAQFIPVAEEIGLIVDIGDWVMDEALGQVAAWIKQGQWLADWRMSINVSPLQFQQADFLPKLRLLLEKHQVPAANVDLEITENMLLSDWASSLAKMNAVRELGVYLSIDDFGTGYSSLKYLKSLPVDRLKIDQSFVRDLLEDKSNGAIVDAVVAMAKALKINVLAEGVETLEHYEYLKKIGCLSYQGYYFARALPANEFIGEFVPAH